MSKFNIIKKLEKGNIYGKPYTIRYQIDNNYAMYEVILYCLGTKSGRVGKFCYMEGKEGFGITTEQDKKDFLKELSKYQQGSSYRKSHPIAQSTLMSMQALYDNKLKELLPIKDEINKLKNEEQALKVLNYRKDIDVSSLNNFLSNFENLFKDSRYILEPYVYFSKRTFTIFDTVLKKYVKMVLFLGNKIEIRDLTNDEIEYLLRH